MTDAHWTKHKNGAFDTAANWSTGAVPTAGINVFLDAMGKPFTVTASGNEAIGDLAVAANATLSLKDGSANAQTFVVGAGEVEGAVSVSNAGKIAVGDNSSLQILAREGDHETYFINRGVITLNARSDNSFLDVQTFNGDGGGFVSLTGGGSIVMSDSALNGIVDTHAGQSENATLFNVDNTISGAGVIGDGGLANGVELSLRNGAAGVIDATGTKNALTLSAPSHYGFANVFNSGLLEATGKAGLNIAGTKVENYGAGRIFAADGSIVRLESATIDGGTLATVGSGIVLASGGSTIEGSRFSSTVTNAGVLQVLGETLYAQDHINNTGAIRLSDAVSAAVLEIKGAGATLSGGGSVVMTDFLGNAIQGDGGDAILINSDNLISGAGQIGGGGLILGNGASGVVDATGTYNSLKLYGAGQTFGNDGLIEATGKAGLEIAGIGLDQTADGTLSVAAGSVARLESAQVFVGSLTNAKGGQVIASGGSGVFDVAVDNQGLFSVVDGDTLTMIGSVVNGGTVSLTGTASAAHLNLAQGNLTLSGGGKLLLGEGGSIDSAAPGYTFTNVDNQILGDGSLGSGATKLVNQAGGVIKETGTSGLTIDCATVVNAGLLEAAGAGDVSVLAAVTNTGLLQADTGSMMSLTSAVKNNGQLIASGGTLIAYQSVSGTGSAAIAGGLLDFTKAFSENVTFTGASGTLALGKSQGYAGQVSGFSTTGGTALDLGDIKFVGAGEASFSGGIAGGTLTVSDGAHTAHIALIGDYTGAAFTASKDGHGGVLITASDGMAEAASPTAGFAGAMAAMAGPGAAPTSAAGSQAPALAALMIAPRAAGS